MSSTYYNLYCDETHIHAGSTFFLGAIRCSPTRAGILEAALQSVRLRYSLSGEMKWTKVSRSMLQVYMDFVDVFLSDPYSSFHLMEVYRGPAWKSFGPNEAIRFFKTYYVFLRTIMSLHSRYTVYVDDKPGKPYRWNQVKYAINRAVLRDHCIEKAQVKQLIPTDSKRSDLIQVVDVILGATVARPGAEAKLKLASYVAERLAQPRFLGNRKLERRIWSP
ncbi:MAG: DUF3800 domain-containing protein [Betaproteobacteria bacterium]